MHFKNYLLALSAILVFTSCNNAGKTDTTNTDSSVATGPQAESREAMFYRQTMDIHNEVMAKMGKLNGYKKRVQQQADSITNMLAHTEFTRSMAQQISYSLDSLHQLGKRLQAADSSMNAWMEGFDPDPKMPDTDAKAAYFEKQKQSAEVMKKQFFDALNDAEKFYSSYK